ncbi:MAG: Hpt domain-containing response regulator [Acidimicrobiales bacterium]
MRHVLAVDDEAVSRLVLGRMLHGLGLVVTEATDVPEAIDLLRAGRFDLVVSDYQMPNGTGLELAEAAVAGGIPFILLTGIGGHGSFDDQRLRLVDAHLTKPASTRELGDVVGMVLRPPVQASGASQPASGPIDLSALQRLMVALGDEAVTVSVIEAFLAELDERCERLAVAIAAGRRDDARHEAHTLAAPSATVGAVELAAWCRAVERESATGGISTLPMAPLWELAKATRTALEQWVETTPPAALPNP